MTQVPLTDPGSELGQPVADSETPVVTATGWTSPPELLAGATIAVIVGAGGVVGALSGVVPALIAVAVVQAVLVGSFVFARALPGRIGALVLGAAAAAAADTFTMRWYEHGYESVLGVLAVAVPLMFCHQLVRGVVRTRVVESLSAVAVLVFDVCAVDGLLLLRRSDGGDQVMAGIVLAITAALLVQLALDAVLALGRFDPNVNRGLLGVVGGLVAGALAGASRLRTLPELTDSHALLAAGGTALVTCLLSVGTSFATVGLVPHRALLVRAAATVIGTVCLCVPAGYVLFNALSAG